jgi:23S rRNA (cytidine2498-2'-O)-methyltransferase
MQNDPQFLFMCCQQGAEAALKAEIARMWPDLRFAFSRPGFVTFKNESRHWGDRVDLKSVFARTFGFSLGQVRGTDWRVMSQSVCEMVAVLQFDQLHVWSRDSHAPGERGYMPRITPDDEAVGQTVQAAGRDAGVLRPDAVANQVARDADHLLDVIRIDEQHWWVGRHRASSIVLRQPGGIFPANLPEHAVSRAYLKMDEAMRWSRLPMRAGDRCVEIGSAPGGSCQALLDRDLYVTGIDPAEMHPTLLAHPRFQHIRKRGADLKRREYAAFDWLIIDTNVAPKHTLDTVEGIVTHPSVHIRGLVLTLKLPNWQLAEHIPEYIARIRGWGYEYTRARQLAHNRHEICVAASKSRTHRG